MNSTPSNGNDGRARTRKANTRALSTGEPVDGQAVTASRRGRPHQAQTRSNPARAASLPPLDSYAAIAIENVQPELDGGHWPIKRVVGDSIQVSADIFKEGHDLLHARVVYRALDEQFWHEEPMLLVENDRWRGRFSVDRNMRYVYSVLAFTDTYGSWRADLQKRLAAAQDVSSELLEGQRLVEEAAARCDDEDDRGRLQAYLARWRARRQPRRRRTGDF